MFWPILLSIELSVPSKCPKVTVFAQRYEALGKISLLAFHRLLLLFAFISFFFLVLAFPRVQSVHKERKGFKTVRLVPQMRI